MFKFQDGIPTINEYHSLISSDFFQAIEKFSDQFIKKHQESLDQYGTKWVKDPLHQWSREFEYPYVLHSIKEIAQSKTPLKILDAGSGLTFFPFLLGQEINDSSIVCLDYDNLKPAFEKIKKTESGNVQFKQNDLRNLSQFQEKSFDAIYCISVLEHTDDYPKIINEFHKLLKEKGKLIVTFDISINGIADIPKSKAKELIKELDKKFHLQKTEVSSIINAIESNQNTNNSITTKKILKINKSRLPWKYPYLVGSISAIKMLLKGKIPRGIFRNLCFCNLTLEKK